jgi:hypothetical protein
MWIVIFHVLVFREEGSLFLKQMCLENALESWKLIEEPVIDLVDNYQRRRLKKAFSLLPKKWPFS